MFSRRQLLKGGLALGLSNLGQFSALADQNVNSRKMEQRNIIFVVFGGGMGAYDSFDYKHDAPRNIKGPFGPQKTKTGTGVFSDQFPSLAAMDDSFGVIRTRKGQSLVHKEAFRLLALSPDSGNLNNYTSRSASGIPYVSGITPRYLFLFGKYLNGFSLNDSIRVQPKQLGGINNEGEYEALVPAGSPITSDQLVTRNALRKRLNKATNLTGSGVDELEQHYGRALKILSSDMLSIFRHSKSGPNKSRDKRYGRNKYGELFNLAGRLADPDDGNVKLVTLHTGEWDHHWNIEKRFGAIGRKLDKALAALIEEYGDRLLIFATGEMGRSPKFEMDISGYGNKPGRDHFLYSNSLLASPDVCGGTYLGETETMTGLPEDPNTTVTDNEFMMAMLALSGDAEPPLNNKVLQTFLA